jgi:Glycosyltransferase family 87
MMDAAETRTVPPTTRVSISLAELAIASVTGLGLAVTALFLCVVPLAGNMAGSRDFVSYWATGHQLVHHANPYDREAVTRIEHAAGLKDGAVLLMRNPPWALPLAYPLGFIGLRTSAFLWSLVLLACLVVSVRLIQRIHNFPENHIHWLGLSFPPALICLIMGQTSLFALLGLVLFLYLHRARPFVAGVSLWLCALKPHLFLPFAVVLLAWIVLHRSYRILAGTAAALALSSAVAYWIDPSAWPLYLHMMRAPEIDKEFIPCLSDALRFWLRPQATSLQYLPVLLCCVWALRYFWLRRQNWNWITNGGTLMLASVVFAPYCWLYDQGLAIPALLHRAYVSRSRTLVVMIALAGLLIDLELCGFKISSGLYLWTAPAWLLFYLAVHTAEDSR